MGISIWQILLILVVVFIIFGAGKLPRVMGDIGKGVRNMREGLKDEAEAAKKFDGKVVEAVDPPPSGHLGDPMAGDVVEAEKEKK